VWPSARFFSENTELITIIFGMQVLQRKLWGKFNFGSYLFSVMPTLHDAQTKLYQFSNKWPV
jgi:hypothetical protein